MKKFYLMISGLFILTSCENFSILERDQKNVVFYKNITSNINNDGRLSLATFNIKLGFCRECDPFSGEIGGDHLQLDKIVDMINSLNLDIVSLQEVAYKYDTSIIENQVKYVAEKTNMNYAYGMGRALQTGGNLFLNGFIGNAILSKYKIMEVENPTIRYVDYYSQNHCLKVKLKLNADEQLLIMNTHLQSGSTNDEKEIQISEILNESEDGIKILMGDFNIPYSSNNQFLSMLTNDFSNSLELLNNNQRSTILNSGTFVSGSVLDYIFVSNRDFNVQSGFLAPSEFEDISDHTAYFLDVTLN